MLDLAALKLRAAARLHPVPQCARVANPASPANDPVAEACPTSQLAALARVMNPDTAARAAREAFEERAAILEYDAGLPRVQAEAAAAGDSDDRVRCMDCGHLRDGYCRNHRAALLVAPDIGTDLANLPQRCRGFQPSR